MRTSKANPKVDAFVSKANKWREETQKLRQIILDCGLTEELKWGHPCYTLEDANIVIIHGFKEYCALLFFKGVLLKDPKGILIRQTENVQGPRQVRFTKLQEITKLERVLKAYVHEAVAVEKSGVKVKMKKTVEFKMPGELKKKFASDSAFKTAFEKLTPGRQRAYILFFSAAKQSTTRESRIEKYTPQILEGIGLNDDYR